MFNNQILKNILLNLNLNERIKFRLINKQFKEIIDSIQFEDDLIIFEKKVPVEGRFKFTNKLWYLDQCVYVTNLNLFFKQFNNKLINLRSLIIYSSQNDIYDFEIDFKQLKHLELHHIQFKSSKILQCSLLENIYLTSDCLFQDNIKLKINKLNNLYISSNLFIKLNLLNNQNSSYVFNYLELNTKFVMDSNLFSIICNLNVKHLIIQTNLDTAMKILIKNKNIKIFDLNLISDLNDCNCLDSIRRLFEFFKLKTDLDFRLFGIKIELSNIIIFQTIFSIINSIIIPFIFIKDGEIFGFRINNHCPLIERSTSNDNFQLFLDRLNWIEFRNHLHINENIFKGMVNVKTILFSLIIESNVDYDEFFNCFPQLEHITIKQNVQTGLNNMLFDSLSSNCLNIQYLKFHYFDSLDFNFLFAMKNLKCLIFLIYYPIDNNLFIDLIEQLEYLSFFAVQFPMLEYDGLNEELSYFKCEFQLAIESIVKSNKFNFAIQFKKEQLKNNTICRIIKYRYERNDYSKKEFKNLDNDLNNNDLKEILKVIDHKGIKFNQFKKSRNYQNNLLIDDILIYIFKNFFDLNERTKLRLVSQQFKFTIDQIFIKKLAVFHLRPRIEFTSDMTGENFLLSDSVYVYDLNKFFKSKSILNSLKNIEKLILFSIYKYPIVTKATFNKLTNLEIYNQAMVTSNIFKSPNINNLLISNCHFYDKSKLYTMNKEDSFFNTVGLNNLNNKIKKLFLSIEIPQLDSVYTEIDFFRECKTKNLLTKLEQLECNLLNLSTIEFINDNFKNLKTLDVNFGRNINELIQAISNNDLDNIADKLREDLTVNLFGCKLTNETVSIVKDFLIVFKDCFEFTCHKTKVEIVLKTSLEWNNFKSIFGQYESLFDGFFRLVRVLVFDQPINNTILNKLDHNLIRSTFYCLSSDFKNFDLTANLKLYSRIYMLRLTGHTINYNLSNILTKLSEYLKNLVDLVIDYDKIDFEFLINLPLTIKSIDLKSKYPIRQELFLNLIKKYCKQNLSFLQNYFQLQKNFDRNQLTNFKNDVLKCINDLKLIDTSFKIEIIRRQHFTIGRYTLKRNNLSSDGDNRFKINEEDIQLLIANLSSIRI